MRFWKWLTMTRPPFGSVPDALDEQAVVTDVGLREFVYLDEVSLRSLLASQQGALTESITELEGKADSAEIAASVGGNVPMVKAEVSSRFQASTKREQQVSRKALAQSLFKEFMELDQIQDSVVRLSELTGEEGIRLSDIRRGALLEVDVELAADPIFRLSTVVGELVDIAKDYPEMTSTPGAAAVLEQMGPINNILQRLMVGLVPLRSRATNLYVYGEGSGRSIGRRAGGDNIGVPIDVVGVTDHLSYWQDVRRLLFAGNKFTVLCRVLQSDITEHWSPVKAADVLAEIMPAFPAQLEAVGTVAYASAKSSPADAGAVRLAQALQVAYSMTTTKLSGPATSMPAGLCADLVSRHAGAMLAPGEIREALDAAIGAAEAACGAVLLEEQKVEVRKASRAKARVQLIGPQIAVDGEPETAKQDQAPSALLEVELIAIYW
jgi:hypothetical protein